MSKLFTLLLCLFNSLIAKAQATKDTILINQNGGEKIYSINGKTLNNFELNQIIETDKEAKASFKNAKINKALGAFFSLAGGGL